MKYYIIAGEASGDLHASNLIKELKRIDANAQFRCWGGDLMKAQGAHVVKHYKDLAFMGFLEVVLNLRTILQNIRFCKNDILMFNPDVVILVDYPGFNLRIADFTNKKKIKTYYYISPQIWAWKQSRVHAIKRTVDKMFVILPFERAFYEKFNYQVDFVGHPLLDAIQNYETLKDKHAFFSKNELANKPIIALLPGSRKQEIKSKLPIMASVVKYFPEYQFVIAAAPSQSFDIYQSIAAQHGIKIVSGQTYDLLTNSAAALVTSGTATLETALCNVPEVVCYKGSSVSYHIAKRLIKVKYISLVNLIMDKEIVKELIQNELTEENLKIELQKIISDTNKIESVKKSYKELEQKLGGLGASKRCAELMYNYLTLQNEK
ncbi:MAG: lipid-A-disaccharide synthase [Bacteroidetes bacterium]|nr:lipid-A-disaccharide synthase [Bacteroidota bacterium]